ncbi:glycoside hydrolase family 3 C-terminal domain-containing protein [Actinomyces bouchesdurhonensis]|uniref:glycoside hydrolase family 3 C-terminal domain-containing protein n=1 Tax=Actinomyces bouchesdurhonensis TaxID=1852361 RepID=UPI0028E4AADF|nr:glycoside hydrolase family 3 C-terminal domain-containing protein [Actinomyces bouchesdurhonensis]
MEDAALTDANDLTLLQAAALLSGASAWDSRAIPAALVPSFVMSDGPHGVRRQLGDADHLGIAESEKATCFPTASALAATWDPDLAREMGEALGLEARGLGVDVLLGPGLNIKRSPLCGRNFEYFSEDPILAGRMAAGLVDGIQSTGTAACPKHFAVNSQELRRMASDSIVDERTMREIYLTGFEIVCRDAGPRVIMSSYNLVNGTHAHENRHLLTDILRDEWGFDGMVVSDWGGCTDAVGAVRAGGSLEMPAPGLEDARRIVAAVKAGELEASDVYARAQEVVNVASASAGLPAPTPYDVDEHHKLATRIASEAITLLRNEDDLLPLSAGTRVALIGDLADTPRFQGSGSSQVNPTRVEAPRELLEAQGEDARGLVAAGYARGYERHGGTSDALIAEAVDLAKSADVALVYVGLDELAESEGLDRPHMRLPEGQDRLIEAVVAANPHTVVVLTGGASVEMPWAGSVPALVNGYLTGQGGAAAMLDVLTGAVNPSGRLAETYARSYEDHPTAAWYPATGPLSYYREGPFVGYRYFTTAGIDVAFPFGYGLSYSRFEYSDLEVDQEGATLTVTNTSERDGADVVQLYVSAPGGVFGPARELKGFAKVEVPAGGSVRVTIPFDRYTFRHWETSRGAWETEAGTWTIYVGPNVEDTPLSATLDVEGTTPSPIDPALGHYLSADVAGITNGEFAVLLGRTIPTAHPTDEITASDPMSELIRAKSWLARLAGRKLHADKAKADAKGDPDLNVHFALNMPLGSIAKFTNGAVSADMIDAVVEVINGHFLRGVTRTVIRYIANARANKATQRELDQAR